MEKDFHIDPAAHENRVYLNISKRAWVTVAITLVACVPIIYLSIKRGWGIYITGMVCLGVGIACGLIFLSKMHHLYFEEWFPYWLAERRAPHELIFMPAVLILPKRKTRFPFAQRIRALVQRSRDKKERKHEDELDAELVKELLEEFDRQEEHA